MMVKEGSQYYNYKYNADGIRIRKNANGITYTYLLDDSGNLIGEKRVGAGVNLRLTYEYDAAGILAFGYSDTITGQRGKLYYQKNVQGDIIGINWASGVTACIYDYDAWGNVILKSGDQYILGLNRILYRGYYQDIETGWYYLQSRYYDPSICRFINADSIDYLDIESLDGLNLYSYCLNNPITYVDPSGHDIGFANFMQGALRILTGVLAISLGIATLAAGGPLSIMLLSVLAMSFGALSAVNGAADIGESFTGSNFIRDGIMGENQGLYDLYGGLVDFGTLATSTGLGVYLANTTSLYRSVSNAEMIDIKQTGVFRQHPKGFSYEGKQFGFSYKETRKFGQCFGQTNIVKTRIPRKLLKELDVTHVDTRIFRAGTITVENNMLDKFNKSLYFIKFL